MEILAIELKSGVVPTSFVGFVENSTSDWGKAGTRNRQLSLRLFKTDIPALRRDQFVVAVPAFLPEASLEGLIEFCEVFYNLDCGQWFVWPAVGAVVS